MGHLDLHITLGLRDRTAQITLAGEIDLKARGPLSAAIDAAMAGQPEQMIFDLTDVRFADSQLAHVLEQALEAGRPRVQVHVVGAQPQVRRVLALSGFEYLCSEGM